MVKSMVAAAVMAEASHGRGSPDGMRPAELETARLGRLGRLSRAQSRDAR